MIEDLKNIELKNQKTNTRTCSNNVYTNFCGLNIPDKVA